MTSLPHNIHQSGGFYAVNNCESIKVDCSTTYVDEVEQKELKSWRGIKTEMGIESTAICTTAIDEAE